MKLLHAADLHLDAPFAALPPDRAALRRSEGRELLARLADLAGQEGVDLVLLPGDLFDGQRVYRETLSALADCLAALAVPVLIAPGNHDPFTPRSPYATLPWPDNVTIFTREQLQAIPFPALNCVVHGAAFCQGRLEHDLLAGFTAPRDGRLHIGVLHGELCQGESPYHPISPASVAASGLDYLALGHIHKASGLQQAGATFYAYPGCPEGHGFDEPGDKGCLILEVEPGRVRAAFHPLASRRYMEVQADVTDLGPLSAARQALADCRPEDCVKLLLTGEWDAAPDLTALEAKLADRVFSLRLRDHTRPRVGLWDRAQEDTLTGAFLRLMRERADSGDERAELAVRFGLAALERGEDCRP